MVVQRSEAAPHTFGELLERLRYIGSMDRSIRSEAQMFLPERTASKSARVTANAMEDPVVDLAYQINGKPGRAEGSTANARGELPEIESEYAIFFDRVRPAVVQDRLTASRGRSSAVRRFLRFVRWR